MAIRLKIPQGRKPAAGGKGRGRGTDPVVHYAFLGFLTLSLLVSGFFAYWYVKYDRIIEQRFRGPLFATSAKIYASPQVVRVGSRYTIADIASNLRRAGYSEKDGASPLGSFHLHGKAIEVIPGPESYHSPEPATITHGRWSRQRDRKPILEIWQPTNWSRRSSLPYLTPNSAPSANW